MRTSGGLLRRGTLGAGLAASLLLGCPAGIERAGAEVRISNLSVFLNDFDVTVSVVLFGAIPDSLYEAINTGIAAHVRYYVELWQFTRMGVDRRLQARMVERQLTYNVLTKEYKVAPLKGEQREPYLTKDIREAQRVISELRVGQIVPVASLDKQGLYYVRVRSDVSLGGVNSWFARMTGEAEETPWVQSSLLTPVRSQ
ncbi:MAG TPA: DUF4390 domain-containing protein [Candidatus Bathyarchaeia archaeon]|nr:DUF4390 domain-containing protein [Candidatus Bathyarchaeia archaeon]